MKHLFQIHHEKMDIYQFAIVFLIFANEILEKIPRGKGEYRDQLQRAALSIVLNFAEGYGKYQIREKQRFYQISKGSAHESAAILDCIKVLNYIDDNDLIKGKKLLYKIICILVKLCQS